MSTGELSSFKRTSCIRNSSSDLSGSGVRYFSLMASLRRVFQKAARPKRILSPSFSDPPAPPCPSTPEAGLSRRKPCPGQPFHVAPGRNLGPRAVRKISPHRRSHSVWGDFIRLGSRSSEEQAEACCLSNERGGKPRFFGAAPAFLHPHPVDFDKPAVGSVTRGAGHLPKGNVLGAGEVQPLVVGKAFGAEKAEEEHRRSGFEGRRWSPSRRCAPSGPQPLLLKPPAWHAVADCLVTVIYRPRPGST